MEIFVYIETYISKKIVNLSINFHYIHMLTWFKLIHRKKACICILCTGFFLDVIYASMEQPINVTF